MAREVFPFKRTGDSLTAQHVNDLGKLVSRANQGARNSFTRANYAVSGTANGVLPYSIITLQINEDNLDGTYNTYLRYYHHETESWKTDVLIEYLLDARESGQVFEVDDIVSAFWHAQRGGFLPMGAGSGPMLRVGKTKDLAVPLDIVDVEVWEDGVATSTIIEAVQHDWITNNIEIPADAEVIIGYFAGEGVWRIIGAECP